MSNVKIGRRDRLLSKKPLSAFFAILFARKIDVNHSAVKSVSLTRRGCGVVQFSLFQLLVS
jgi:hypothetical protein